MISIFVIKCSELLKAANIFLLLYTLISRRARQLLRRSSCYIRYIHVGSSFVFFSFSSLSCRQCASFLSLHSAYGTCLPLGMMKDILPWAGLRVLKAILERRFLSPLEKLIGEITKDNMGAHAQAIMMLTRQFKYRPKPGA